ncbi:efflux transporter outer membrane subunit [Lichenicola sp.]|uniref:efflux transporter outer membrane subunit n=1 Tax=Lichenicola sp. TaxID=2804529 RepID=UPI003AFF6474
MASRPRLQAALVGAAFIVSGCTVGPDFKRPSLWSPGSWTADHPGQAGPSLAGNRPAPIASLPDPSAPDPHWWDIFHDPELSALEARAARSNLNVRLATARLAESRAQLRITGAAQYPTLNGTGSYSRTQISDKLIQRGLSNGVGELPNTGSIVSGSTLNSIRDYAGEVTVPPVDLWEDGIDASWELDLWGRVRRQVEAAHATLVASAEDRRSTLIAELAEVARDYMMLRGTQAQLAIAIANQKTAEQSVTLTRQRFVGGLTSELDVQNALQQLDITTAAIPNDEQQVAQQINALSLLLGEPPQALRAELETAAPVPPVPPRVPIGIPSELARRRPDIREAEARLHAATATVGVAVASFYPSVTLTGALNFQTLSFRDLAFWSAAAYNFGPSITLPIFEGGRLRGQLQLDKAQQTEAAISYQQTVLGAWHDVDNALVAFAAEQRRHDQLVEAGRAADRALTLAREQYTHGLDTFLNVLDAERTLLSAQQQLSASTTTESANLVQLYTALGGGWETIFPSVGHDGDLKAVASGSTLPAEPAQGG